MQEDLGPRSSESSGSSGGPGTGPPTSTRATTPERAVARLSEELIRGITSKRPGFKRVTLEQALARVLAGGLSEPEAQSWVERLLRTTTTLVRFEAGLRDGPPVEVAHGA